ncbi:MAG: MBL fold metallo-hydrolase [Victivallaceae bacterium]|nr:MBL fold metallo-hydrolase [Victivallaceae bacterium]
MIIPNECAVKPFRIYGNCYFVGTIPASSHLIDTGDGLILIDPGFPQLLHLVLESIGELGFDPHDIRHIINTHGHYDHLGATRRLAEMTGAKTFLGREDADYANGKVDLSWAKELGYRYEEHEFFQPDVLLDDGSTIELGDTKIRCRHTPGHTPGTTSFFLTLHGDRGDKAAGMFGGNGVNTLRRDFLLAHPELATMRRAYRESIAKLMTESVDIHLGNHVNNNDTLRRGGEVLAGNPDAFVDPDDWRRFLRYRARQLDEIEENEPIGE